MLPTTRPCRCSTTRTLWTFYRRGGALGVLDEDRGRDEVLYVHQLLQEYFAARLLARQPQPALVQQEWRADRVVPDLPSTLRDLADADPLPPLPSTGWEETTVLAAAMASDPARFITDLMAHNLALAGRCAAQPEVAVSEALKATVRGALVERTQDPHADLRARIAAGLALGELGDPRLSVGKDPMVPTCCRRSSSSLGARIPLAATKGCMIRSACPQRGAGALCPGPVPGDQCGVVLVHAGWRV